MRNCHVILPDKVEEFDADVRNARKRREIPVEPAMPCGLTITRPNCRGTDAESVVSKEAGGDPKHEAKGDTLLQQEREENKSF